MFCIFEDFWAGPRFSASAGGDYSAGAGRQAANRRTSDHSLFLFPKQQFHVFKLRCLGYSWTSFSDSVCKLFCLDLCQILIQNGEFWFDSFVCGHLVCSHIWCVDCDYDDWICVLTTMNLVWLYYIRAVWCKSIHLVFIWFRSAAVSVSSSSN